MNKEKIEEILYRLSELSKRSLVGVGINAVKEVNLILESLESKMDFSQFIKLLSPTQGLIIIANIERKSIIPAGSREIMSSWIVSTECEKFHLDLFRSLFGLFEVKNLPRTLSAQDVKSLLVHNKISLCDYYKRLYTDYYGKNINPVDTAEDCHQKTLDQLVQTIVFCEGFGVTRD